MTAQIVAPPPPSEKRAEPELLPELLRVVTFNNGQERMVRRTPKVARVVRLITDAVIRHNVLSVNGGEMFVCCHFAAGSAAFKIIVHGIDVATGYACWNAHINAISWEIADRLFHELSEMNEALDCGYEYRDAPSAPWVAAVLLPAYARISAKHQRWIAVLEPCAVWALWDNEREIEG